jgi:hypothetical protein
MPSSSRQVYTVCLDKGRILDKGSSSRNHPPSISKASLNDGGEGGGGRRDGVDVICIAIEEGFGDFQTIWSIDVCGVLV